MLKLEQLNELIKQGESIRENYEKLKEENQGEPLFSWASSCMTLIESIINEKNPIYTEFATAITKDTLFEKYTFNKHLGLIKGLKDKAKEYDNSHDFSSL